MDPELSQEKLESLRRCLRRIVEKRPATAEALVDDYDLQDIIALNLERAIQICVDLAAMLIADRELTPPETMAGSFDCLQQAGVLSATLAERMKKAVGFRNIAVHSYQRIDWRIVFEICHRHVADFETFAGVIHRSIVGTP
ncbi:MAG: type VII toxin-antitoxin system HepT family RNase toxin [Limisphaerales bacterium]